MRKARARDDEKAISSFNRTRKSSSAPGEKRTTHYGNIIRQYREMNAMDQRTVGEALGFSTNTISNWENGVSRPDIDAIPKLCELLHIPFPVFFDVEQDPAAPESETALIKAFRQLGEDRKQAVLQLTRHLARSEMKLHKAFNQIKASRVLPVASLSAAAGIGVPMEEVPTQERAIVADNTLSAAADFICQVNGDSMEPTYQNGDYVYVRYSKDLSYGDVGIFIVAGAAYIKEYRKSGLYSHNKAYRLMKVSADDDVRLIGQVLGRVAPEDLLENQLRNL